MPKKCNQYWEIPNLLHSKNFTQKQIPFSHQMKPAVQDLTMFFQSILSYDLKIHHIFQCLWQGLPHHLAFRVSLDMYTDAIKMFVIHCKHTSFEFFALCFKSSETYVVTTQQDWKFMKYFMLRDRLYIWKIKQILMNTTGFIPY